MEMNAERIAIQDHLKTVKQIIMAQKKEARSNSPRINTAVAEPRLYVHVVGINL